VIEFTFSEPYPELREAKELVAKQMLLITTEVFAHAQKSNISIGKYRIYREPHTNMNIRTLYIDVQTTYDVPFPNEGAFNSERLLVDSPYLHSLCFEWIKTIAPHHSQYNQSVEGLLNNKFDSLGAEQLHDALERINIIWVSLYYIARTIKRPDITISFLENLVYNANVRFKFNFRVDISI
jgi:hypothetical protein